MSLLSFKVENLEVLIIQTISFTCNLDIVFDLGSKANENFQTPKIEPLTIFNIL